MKPPKNKLQRYLEYFFDYAPVVLTVTVATLASFSVTRSAVEVSEMLQWILVVLTLLATTQLADRIRFMRNLDNKVDKLVENISSSGANSFFVRRMPNLIERLRTAKSISINGITLSTTSGTFFGVFEQRIKDGAQIRLMIVDPNKPVMDIIVNRFHKHQDTEKAKREIEHTLDNLKALASIIPTRGRFQVRLFPHAPPYGIWIIDANRPNAEIWVELYSYRDYPEPTFHLLPLRDGEWFEFFNNQFETMWSASEKWDASE